MWDYERRFLMLLGLWKSGFSCYSLHGIVERRFLVHVYEIMKRRFSDGYEIVKRRFLLLFGLWKSGFHASQMGMRLWGKNGFSCCSVGTQQKLWCKNYDTGVNGGLHHAFTPVLICRVISTPSVVILPPLVVILTLFNWCYVQTLGCNLTPEGVTVWSSINTIGVTLTPQFLQCLRLWKSNFSWYSDFFFWYDILKKLFLMLLGWYEIMQKRFLMHAIYILRMGMRLWKSGFSLCYSDGYEIRVLAVQC